MIDKSSKKEVSQLPYGGKQVLRQDCDGKLIYEDDMSQLPYGGNKSYDTTFQNRKSVLIFPVSRNCLTAGTGLTT